MSDVQSSSKPVEGSAIKSPGETGVSRGGMREGSEKVESRSDTKKDTIDRFRPGATDTQQKNQPHVNETGKQEQGQERDRFSSNYVESRNVDRFRPGETDTQQKSQSAVHEVDKQGQERDRFSSNTVERGKVDRFRPGGNETNTQRPENQNAQNQRETQFSSSETTKVNENRQSENANREVVKAETIPEKAEVIPQSSMSTEQREKMNELLKEREKAQSEKARLEPQGESRDLTKARYEMNDASRKLGEQAADYYGTETRKAEKVYPDREGSRSGDFDRVYKTADKDGTERYVVIEAKGGNSRLGERTTENGVRAQQGSSDYFDSIAANMSRSGNTVGSELQFARIEGRVEYVKVHAPIVQREGGDRPGDIKVTHFKLE